MGAVVSHADSPEYAAVRAFSDLPALPDDVTLPERETFRARLLAHDIGSTRDRLRERAQARLAERLRRIEIIACTGDLGFAGRLNHWMFGAVMFAHDLDIITCAEAAEWQQRAMDALRGVR